MDNKDQIKDLFAEKLGQMEMPVRAELWSAISSQIGAGTATAASTGLSIVAKIVIGVTVVAASTVAGVYLLQDHPKDTTSLPKKTEEMLSSSNVTEEVVEAAPAEVLQQEISKIPNLQDPTFNENVLENKELNKVNLNESERSVEMSTESANVVTSLAQEKESSQPANETAANTSANGSTPVIDPVAENVEEVDQKSTIQLILPNIITPNGDRNNDELFIESSGLSDFNIVILDQMSKVVYQSTDPNFKWDGTTMAGDSVAAGNYIYYITAVDANGKKVSKYSSLRVTR